MMDGAILRRCCAWSRQARNPRCTSSRSRAIYGRLVDTSGPYPRKYTGCVRHNSDVSSVALLVYAVNRSVVSEGITPSAINGRSGGTATINGRLTALVGFQALFGSAPAFQGREGETPEWRRYAMITVGILTVSTL